MSAEDRMAQLQTGTWQRRQEHLGFGYTKRQVNERKLYARVRYDRLCEKDRAVINRNVRRIQEKHPDLSESDIHELLFLLGSFLNEPGRVMAA